MPRYIILWLTLALGLILIACDSGPNPADIPESTATIPQVAATLPPVTPSVTRTTIPPPASPSSVVETAAPSEYRQGLPPNEEAGRLGEAAMQTLMFLTNDLSPRASGTEEEAVAAEYLRDEFAALGYESSIQPFEVRSISPFGRLLTVDATETMDFRALPMWMTAEGVVTGDVVEVGRALPGDIPADGIEGKIALIERGEVAFDAKLNAVVKAGAIGAVVYNNEPGPFGGALSEETIPAVTISQEDGETLKSILNGGTVTATISLEYTEESRNVIADKRGTADDNRVVVLGGHYDTVPNVPGANDNGSGIATLLTIAREIADREYPFTVRFIAFGAEELGLFGSDHYVEGLSEADISSTMAMLNFDALGTGPQTAMLGTPSLLKMMEEYAEQQDINTKMVFSFDWGASDHAPFDEAGIPHVVFLGEDFSRIHTPEDKLEFVQTELLGGAALLAIGLLNMFAEDDE